MYDSLWMASLGIPASYSFFFSHRGTKTLTVLETFANEVKDCVVSWTFYTYYFIFVNIIEDLIITQ